MGRLFWKVLLFTLLAQFITALGIGLAIHVENASNERSVSRMNQSPMQRGHEFDPAPPPPNSYAYPLHENGPHPPGGHPPSPVIPIVSALLCSVLFSTMIAWYFSKPIKNLRAAFESVAGGDLDINAVAGMGGRRDELTDLGRDFDRMVLHLRALLDSQRRLMHDISHELRSPLARLHVAAGLARQQPERLDESLQRIENESERMDKLVGELLTLSKLDAGVASPRHESIYMAELIADIVSDTQFEAQAHGKQLVFTGACTVCVRGDSELFRQAIENVVRNALKHTAPGSAVTLDACALGMQLNLTVLDSGPGVPESDLERIFEPFYRGSGSSYNSDGHGLGLAISRRILNNAAGSIRAENRTEGGLRVTICLPVETHHS